MNPIQKITALGQSIWLDSIQRSWLEDGRLEEMIARGDIRGLTSNPSIFQQAIANSADYDTALTAMAWAGWTSEKILWELASEDIRRACDLLMPLYEESNGGDGFVSLEEDPLIAHDTDASVSQAQQLWARIGRPNLLVKIPATREGIPAIQRSIAEGVNVNVTLVFSLARYQEVIEAYLAGLEARSSAGRPIDHIASVASFFVSRLDTKIDGWLPPRSPLRGKAAIANARLAYQHFIRATSSERWKSLAAKGARIQRPLWASTSTKNPAYPDTLYIDSLIGEHTVNTVPPATIEAVKDHGTAAHSILDGVEQADELPVQLADAGISLERATSELEAEGVKAFADAWVGLIHSIDARRSAAVQQLGPLADRVAARVVSLEAESAPRRVWQRDPSLWATDEAGQEEVRRRLGWLDLPEASRAVLPEMRRFAEAAEREGVRHHVLLGMGGSALAPEVFSAEFAGRRNRLTVLDSTNPDEIRAAASAVLPPETLYLVSSKSGDTAEVLALLDYFYAHAGEDGSRFAAITDPGTRLEELARTRRFRQVFLADPSVGGRYSALSVFGLLPATLVGADPQRLLERATWMRAQCLEGVPAARNPGLVLGAVLGEGALSGRDKLILLCDDRDRPLAAWLEQLVAESTGKKGRGLIPIVGGRPRDPASYSNDSLFVCLYRDEQPIAAIEPLRSAGHPVVMLGISSAYDIGAEIFRWEFATAMACHILGVNAFDQPDVQDTKVRTRESLIRLIETGVMTGAFYGESGAHIRTTSRQQPADMSIKTAAAALLSASGAAAFLAVNAYVERNDVNMGRLRELQALLAARSGRPVSLGVGPRFLHSTGQLQKGGPAGGLMLQITAACQQDLPVPTQELTFAQLEAAQAAGDFEALASKGRVVFWIHLDSAARLAEVLEAFL